MLSKLPAGAEKFLAVLVAAGALAHLILMGHALATTSLTTDEFGTIFSYSAKGPLAVVTSYSGPKNHVFFNLLNSITPGRTSIEPWRARLYSFVATAGLLAVIVAMGIATGRWLEAAAWLAAWTASGAALEMGLLARGYGVLALAAAFSCLATVRYFGTQRPAWLIALGVATVLGVYTIPGYLFFGGPLLLAVWAIDRRRLAFWVGVGTALTLLALYAPVFAALWRETGDYALKDERDFGRWSDVLRAVRVYGISGPDWLLALWVMAPLPLAFLARRTSPLGSALRAIAPATIACFGILLWLQTPPLRMAAFVMVPLAFAVVFGAGDLLRRVRPPVLAAALAVGFTVWIAAKPLAAILPFRHLPLENWAAAAGLIDAAFPRDVAIDFGRHGKYLKYYLDPARPVVKDAASVFSNSGVVIVDAHRLWVNAARNPDRTFVAAERDPCGIELVVPGAWRDVAIGFAAPALASPPERIPAGWHAGFDVPPGTFSAVVTFDRPLRGATALATLREAGEETPLHPLVVGNAVVVPLDGRRSGKLEVTVNTGRDDHATAAALVPGG